MPIQAEPLENPIDTLSTDGQVVLRKIIEDGVEFGLTVALVRQWAWSRQFNFAKGDLWWVRRVNGLPMNETENTLKFRTFHEMLDWLLNDAA